MLGSSHLRADRRMVRVVRRIVGTSRLRVDILTGELWMRMMTVLGSESESQENPTWECEIGCASESREDSKLANLNVKFGCGSGKL